MWLTYIYNGVEGAVAARKEQWWWLGRTVMMVELWSLRSMTFQVDDLLSGIFRPYKSNSRQVLFNYTLPKINLNSMQERTVGTGCNWSLSVLNIWKCWWTHRPDCGLWSWSVLRISSLDRSWSGPISVFFQSSNWTFKHYKSLNCYFFPISGYSGIYSQKYMTSSQDINLISIKSKSMWYVFLYASTILLQNMLIQWVCGTWGKVAWQWYHNFYIRKWCLMT